MECLESWAARDRGAFQFIYLRREDCCRQMLRSLRATPTYIQVYDGPGATIFARAQRR